MRRTALLVAAVAAVLVLVAVIATCSPGDETTTTSLTVTTRGGSTQPVEASVTLSLAPFSEMGPGWSEQVFAYGEGEEFLGVSPGGDGLMLGPEYGAQAPDGTWWFLDAAGLRIAHFAEDGPYLGQVVLSEELLVDGQYFQYQMPQALDDGSIVAAGFRAGTTMDLLRIVDDTAFGTSFEGQVPWVTTDGVRLFGLDSNGAPHQLDPEDPIPEPVDWLLARDGSRYLATVRGDEVVVELPEVGVTRTLQMRFSEDPEVSVFGGIEVETGLDGTIFILITGVPVSDETLDVGGLVAISSDGTVGETEPITDPTSPADPGSPARLGIWPGTSDPWLMVVGVDGVHLHAPIG